jgi:hypothetical protein
VPAIDQPRRLNKGFIRTKKLAVTSQQRSCVRPVAMGPQLPHESAGAGPPQPRLCGGMVLIASAPPHASAARAAAPRTRPPAPPPQAPMPCDQAGATAPSEACVSQSCGVSQSWLRGRACMGSSVGSGPPHRHTSPHQQPGRHLEAAAAEPQHRLCLRLVQQPGAA